MKKPLVLFVLLALILAPGALKSTASDSAAIQAEINRILDAQEAAWNLGDLRGYMFYYWESDDLTFQSGTRRFKGWQVMLSRYEKNYPPEKRGKLKFSEIEIHLIGDDSAYVIGRWTLLDSNSTEQSGLFTLVFRKLAQGWKIVLDHTS